jgi:transposase InsO family protein
VVRVLVQIWEAAGRPWSVRLKAALPLWLKAARRRMAVSPATEKQLLAMSPRTMDRSLSSRRRTGHKLFGRTKPGTLLRHQIPIQTAAWKTGQPGYVEMDLVSHSGPNAAGEFLHSLNVTDLESTWNESRAVMGKGEVGVVTALEQIAAALPFALRGVDSDNGSEFINHHLLRYCRKRGIAFTRSRPYKKDDNAHIEQKNWTHVRRVLGWDRYDSEEALAAINDLYCHELRWMMNLFQPSVRLVSRERIGARLKRRYDAPQTPLDRLIQGGKAHPQCLAELVSLRQRIDPFTLSEALGQKLETIFRLASRPVLAAPHAQANDRLTPTDSANRTEAYGS